METVSFRQLSCGKREQRWPFDDIISRFFRAAPVSERAIKNCRVLLLRVAQCDLPLSLTLSLSLSLSFSRKIKSKEGKERNIEYTMMYSRCTGAHRRRRIACCRTVPGRGPVHRATQAGVASRRTPTGERRREGRTSTTGPAAILAGTRRRPARWWTSFATTRSKSRASSWRSLPSRALVTVAEREGYLSFFLSPRCARVSKHSRAIQPQEPSVGRRRMMKDVDDLLSRISCAFVIGRPSFEFRSYSEIYLCFRYFVSRIFFPFSFLLFFFWNRIKDR